MGFKILTVVVMICFVVHVNHHTSEGMPIFKAPPTTQEAKNMDEVIDPIVSKLIIPHFMERFLTKLTSLLIILFWWFGLLYYFRTCNPIMRLILSHTPFIYRSQKPFLGVYVIVAFSRITFCFYNPISSRVNAISLPFDSFFYSLYAYFTIPLFFNDAPFYRCILFLALCYDIFKTWRVLSIDDIQLP